MGWRRTPHSGCRHALGLPRRPPVRGGAKLNPLRATAPAAELQRRPAMAADLPDDDAWMALDMQVPRGTKGRGGRRNPLVVSLMVRGKAHRPQ